jgi:hypothetical protein
VLRMGVGDRAGRQRRPRRERMRFWKEQRWQFR